MSTPATLPMLGSDGQVHSVPMDRLGDAVNAGGKPVGQVKDPQGALHWVTQDQMEGAINNKGTVISRAPTDEEVQFLQQNPGHQWLNHDPQTFPNREEGIYPAGPGNEWRNDPNSPMRTTNQAAIDLHLLKHTGQAAGESAIITASAMAPEALGEGWEALKPALTRGVVGIGEWAAAHPVAARLIWSGIKKVAAGTAVGAGIKLGTSIIKASP